MYDLVAFDLDVTLIYIPENYMLNTVNATLKELGAELATLSQAKRLWLKPNRDSFIENEFGFNSNLFWPIFCKYDTAEERQKHVEVCDDIHFIKKLKRKNIKTAVITGSPQHIAGTELNIIKEELGGNYFDMTFSLNPNNKIKGIRQKPHTCGMIKCVKNSGARNAMYVGDSDEDIIFAQEAAKQTRDYATITDVWIKRGNYTLDNGIRPTKTINSLYELERLFK